MGWTGMHLEDGTSKLNAAIATEGFSRDDIVATNTAGNAVYIALRIKTGDVIGIVCLVEKNKEGETLVKCMDEDMGPFYFGASARTLAALTPTTHEEGLKWRARCAANALFKKGATVVATRAIGDVPAGNVGRILRTAAESIVVSFEGVSRLYRVRRSMVEVRA